MLLLFGLERNLSIHYLKSQEFGNFLQLHRNIAQMSILLQRIGFCLRNCQIRKKYNHHYSCHHCFLSLHYSFQKCNHSNQMRILCLSQRLFLRNCLLLHCKLGIFRIHLLLLLACL